MVRFVDKRIALSRGTGHGMLYNKGNEICSNEEEVVCNPPAPPSPHTINMKIRQYFVTIDIVVDFNSYIKFYLQLMVLNLRT